MKKLTSLILCLGISASSLTTVASCSKTPSQRSYIEILESRTSPLELFSHGQVIARLALGESLQNPEKGLTFKLADIDPNIMFCYYVFDSLNGEHLICCDTSFYNKTDPIQTNLEISYRGTLVLTHPVKITFNPLPMTIEDNSHTLEYNKDTNYTYTIREAIFDMNPFSFKKMYGFSHNLVDDKGVNHNTDITGSTPPKVTVDDKNKLQLNLQISPKIYTTTGGVAETYDIQIIFSCKYRDISGTEHDVVLWTSVFFKIIFINRTSNI